MSPDGSGYIATYMKTPAGHWDHCFVNRPDASKGDRQYDIIS